MNLKILEITHLPWCYKWDGMDRVGIGYLRAGVGIEQLMVLIRNILLSLQNLLLKRKSLKTAFQSAPFYSQVV